MCLRCIALLLVCFRLSMATAETINQPIPPRLIRAEDRQRWAFRPLKRPAVPVVPAELERGGALDGFGIKELGVF